nr:WAT1-related protein At5g40230-like [Ziziphus jujuba var. spinosa]
MVWRRCCYGEVVPFAAMAAVECTNVGLNTLFKAATLKGMSYLVFILYSYALGSLILLPLPFIFRRYLLFSANICAYKGIEYSSPTLASALSNLTPAFTFVLAIILR